MRHRRVGAVVKTVCVADVIALCAAAAVSSDAVNPAHLSAFAPEFEWFGPPDVCPNPAHGCCTGGSPGCSDEACCKVVCAVDPFCCEVLWDNLCIAQVAKLCPGLCDVACPNSRHDCCTQGGPGCADSDCCETVCAIEPFCCDYAWDSLCVKFAASECAKGCPTCLGDLDGDDLVNVIDLVIVINYWGPCPMCVGDINGDQVVNALDLLIVINAWGPCP